VIDGRIAAFGVHAFTALGAVFGFQALIEVVAHRWEAAFAWLGAALIVDGLDGPLARRVAVSSKLPRFSGERLDLIIDYLTYVLVPAYVIYEARLVPDGLALFAAALILLTSLFHFIDHESKTEDGFFVGFPALWNIVALYFLIFMPHPAINFIILLALASLTFFPLKWIHPIRVKRMRPLTLVMMAAWGLAAIAALFQGFPASTTVQAVIAMSAIYFIYIGLSRSFNRTG
jgi:phosphatidylcholine synthase